MRNLSLITALLLILAACGNSGNNKEKQNEKAEKSEIPGNLEIEDWKTFWKKFQNIVANDDKAAFMHLCADRFKYFGEDNYDRFINARMKKEIKTAKAGDIQGNDTNRQFIYYNEGSSFGFFFVKKNGVWKISGQHAGG